MRKPKTSEKTQEIDIYGGFFGSEVDEVDEMLIRNHDLFFTEATEINPEHCLIEKILIGDTSDNIKSCFKYFTKNGAKEYGFTDTRFANMVNKGEVIELKHLESEEGYSELIDMMVTELKSAPRNQQQKKKDFEMLTHNRSLIDLSEGYRRYAKFIDVEGLGMDIQSMLSTPNIPLSRLVIERPIGIDY